MPSRKTLAIAATTVLLTLATPLLPSDEHSVFAQTVQTEKAEADRLFNQGIQQYQTSKFTAALQSWQQALTLYRQTQDRRGEGNALGNLGLAYDALGNYGKAIEFHQQYLAIARELKNRQGEGNALNNLGVAYDALGNYGKAIEFHQQHLAIARELKNRQGEGASLGNLGNVYQSLGDYRKAIEFHQQSLAIDWEIKDRKGEGQSLGNLGIAYYALGDYRKAIEFHQQSLAITRAIKDRKGEGASLGNLGAAYQALGNYHKAIEFHQQHLAIARAIQDQRGEGTSLGNLGNAYYSLDDYGKAIEFHQQSLAIARAIQDQQGEGNALGNLGNAYYALGDYRKAIEFHQQHLAIARELKDRRGEGHSLGNLGIAYRSLGDYGKAIEFHQQRLAIARAIQDRQGEGTSLHNLGLALFKANNLVQAEKVLFEGIEVWESLRAQLANDDHSKVSIFEQQARTYRTLQRVLIAANKPNTALEIAERGRARAFVEQLTRRLQATAPTAFLTLSPPTLAQIQQIAKSHNATLVQYSIIYDDFKLQGKQKLQESDLYIWVIKPTGEVSFRQANLKPLWQQQNASLSALVDQSRDLIGVRSRSQPTAPALKLPDAEFSRDLKQLHQLLIDPIADLLPTNPNNHVIFVPQGTLFLVPFPALQAANGKSLIEQHTILTAPAIQVLQLTQQQRWRSLSKRESRPRNPSQSALVVGNPTMPKLRFDPTDPPESLSNLPGAKAEAENIAALLNTKAITGNQATKAAIVRQMPTARIIHLATHGLLDDFAGVGIPGAIALAPDGTGKENDGLLTANEILDMQLTADLVVLSACDTGRGKLTGDGVVGLSRSFINAGVPSILVSLWKVPDRSTALLMTEFYKNLQQKLDRATALRQAMLTVKRQQPDPVHWAAFTLIGEAE
jgi:CHAT domain-containing protein